MYCFALFYDSFCLSLPTHWDCRHTCQYVAFKTDFVVYKINLLSHASRTYNLLGKVVSFAYSSREIHSFFAGKAWPQKRKACWQDLGLAGHITSALRKQNINRNYCGSWAVRYTPNGLLTPASFYFIIVWNFQTCI